MSKKFRKNFGLSKRTDHPTSHSSGQSTPDPHSSDQPTADPRTSGQYTPNQQRTTDPYVSQPIPQPTSGGHPGPYSSFQPTREVRSDQRTPDPRSSDQGGHRTSDPIFSGQSTSASRSRRRPPVSPHFSLQPTPDTRTSDQYTPNQQRIADPYGGQPIPQATSSGHPGPYFNIQLAVPAHFGDQRRLDPSSDDETTPNWRPITTNRYSGGQHILEPTSSGQHAPVPRSSTPIPRSSGQPAVDTRLSVRPTPRPRPSGQHTPNLQRKTDPHGGSEGTAVPRSSGQGTSVSRSSNQRISVPRSSGRPTVNPHISPPSIPDTRSSDQYTPNQQRITDPHGGQPIPQATSSGHPGPYFNSQLAVHAHFGDQLRLDPRSDDETTPKSRPITTDRYSSGQHILPPTSSGQHAPVPPYSTPIPRSSGQPTVNPRLNVQPTQRPRSSGQHTPNLQRKTDPHGSSEGTAVPRSSGQRTPVSRSSDQHTSVPRSGRPTVNPHFSLPSIPDTRTSDQYTPNQQRITDLHGGQPIPQATSSGHPGPYFNSQLAVHAHFGDQPRLDPRSDDETTPKLRPITTDRYSGGQHILSPTSSGQHAPVPPYSTPIPRSSGQPTVDPRLNVQPTQRPRSSGQHTPNLQRKADPHGSSEGTAVPRSSGQRTPVSRSSDQHTSVPRSGRPTVNPNFGLLFIPDPRTSDQYTPNQQRITDLHGGQPIPQATSNGQSISDGIYTITNVYQKRFIYLEDANDKTPLRGHYNPENCSARWHVVQRVDGEYSIKHVDYGRYAYCGSRARLDAFVEGHSEEQVWHIQERYEGQYMIAAIDSGNLWMLPDKEKDTPVTFSKVPSDPMCLWSFESVEIVALVNENPIAQPVVPDPGLPLAPPGAQPMLDAAIVEFNSVIAGAPDLLQPLGAACEALRVVLQREESIGHVNKGRKALIKRLKFHLATVENDIAKLKEDQRIDEIIPALNQDVRKSLETYARELKEIYEILWGNQPNNSSLVDEVTSKTHKIDEIFQIYTPRKRILRLRKRALFDPTHMGFSIASVSKGRERKTLRAIGDWVDNEDAENWIFFLLDVAGSGKSTVAKHMAEQWKRDKQLLARFFFSRDTTATMSTDLFCSTVANAFAVLDPEFKKHMEEFNKRLDLGLLSFEELFEGLVAGPLREIGRHAILIIDALDECHPEQRDQLLQTLRDQHSSIPFLRILATGRPERDIKGWAEEKFGFSYTNFIRLEKSEKDVELYIKQRLQDLPIAQDRLYPVIHHAEGLFIWARIACDLLLDSDDIDGLLEELGKEVSLDYLYKVALEQSMPKEGASRRAMVQVLRMILAAREPLSIAELEVLSPKRGVVEKVVTRLSSVLLYQGREDPIRLLHATFREFLTTRSKAHMFFIQPELGHHTLASGCLTTIAHRSKQGGSDATSRRKVISFEQDAY